jgi:hypothetical protein
MNTLAWCLLFLNPPDRTTEFVGLITDKNGQQVHIELEVNQVAVGYDIVQNIIVKVDREDTSDFRVQWGQYELCTDCFMEYDGSGFGWERQDEWVELIHDGEVIFRMYVAHWR